MMRITLRLIAIAIAVAAAVDPSIAVDAATRPRIAVVVGDADGPDAGRVRDDLARDLAADYDVIPQIVSDAAAAIVIGTRYPIDPVPDSLRVMTVTMPPPADAVRIVRLVAPREVPPATRIRVDVELDAHGAAGRTTNLGARVGGVETSVVSHRWLQVDERWRASLDVVPVGEPPFVVRIAASTATAGGATESTAADVVVRRRTIPLAVEFVDARPSWASTFVRRALEGDPRFRVESVSGESRGVVAKTAGAVPLADAQLDRFDAVVVGGLDRVTTTDVAGVERYMREREGAVVVLPDQRIESGPARALLPEFTERLLERPAALLSPSGGAVLRASELLVAQALPPGADVLMQMPAETGGAVIVTMPQAAGRLLVSGAMDAWRDRAADGAAFDRFWQATIAGLALTTPPPIDVEVTPAVLRPREAATVIVRVRGAEPARVSAAFGGQPLRLVPDAGRGVYRGRVTASESARPATLDVEAVDARGARQSAVQPVPIVVDAAPRLAPVAAPLSLLSASHHGLDVPPGRTGEITQALRQSVRPTHAIARQHPMRSPWWLLPFVACLSAEWWARRRLGQR
jgi:hypothetical protein